MTKEELRTELIGMLVKRDDVLHADVIEDECSIGVELAGGDRFFIVIEDV
jgi:hypothetical protein